MIRGVEQLEARVAHNHEVASSSLAPAILDYNKFPFEKAFIVRWVLSFLQNLKYDKRKRGLHMSNMTRTDFIKNCWRFYLVLEKRFMATTQYVELSIDNYDTYSLEYVDLLQSIGSELDVFMKVVCGFEQTEFKTIKNYCDVLLGKYKNIKTQKVSVKYFDGEIKPFDGWDADHAKQSLAWWEAYDLVKHGRIENFKLAKLENILKALAALYLLEMYYLKDIAKSDEMDIPEKESELFFLDNWNPRFMTSNGLLLEIINDKTVGLVTDDKALNIDGGKV